MEGERGKMKHYGQQSTCSPSLIACSISNIFLQDEVHKLAFFLLSRSSPDALLKQWDEEYTTLFKNAAELLCNPLVKNLLVLYDRIIMQTKPEDLLAPATAEEIDRVFGDLLAIALMDSILAISFVYDLGAHAKTRLYHLYFFLLYMIFFI
jgi:hypothetical protein